MHRSVPGLALAAALILGACGGGGASDNENEVSPSGAPKLGQQSVDVWEGSMHSEGFTGHRRRNGVVYYDYCTGSYDSHLRIIVSHAGDARGEAEVITQGKKCASLSKGLPRYTYGTGSAKCLFGIEGELKNGVFEINFTVDPSKGQFTNCGVGFDPFVEANLSATHEIQLTEGGRVDAIETVAGPGHEPQNHGTSRNTIHLSRTCTSCVNPTP